MLRGGRQPDDPLFRAWLHDRGSVLSRSAVAEFADARRQEDALETVPGALDPNPATERPFGCGLVVIRSRSMTIQIGLSAPVWRSCASRSVAVRRAVPEFCAPGRAWRLAAGRDPGGGPGWRGCLLRTRSRYSPAGR